jgi:Ni2+-binding GTPase involved in maturation of urease and hydrogenase
VLFLRFVIVSGLPSSGKTAVMLHTIRHLLQEGLKVAACKMDCLNTSDDQSYRALGIPVAVGLSEYLCPDHFFAVNLEEVFNWACNHSAEVLILETAGLCHRCAPAVEGCLSICVIDNLSGIDTPQKVGPMLSTADIVVISKGDIVSQAEREVFRQRVEMVNPEALIFAINGLNGQGTLKLKKSILECTPIDQIEGKELRCSMPAAICSYCTGETLIGSSYQMGNIKKVYFGRNEHD